MGKVRVRYVKQIGPYYYYRRDGEYTRLVGEPGSTEFASSYAEARKKYETPAIPEHGDLLASLIVAYKASPEYLSLRPVTKAGYKIHLDALSITYGHCALSGLTRKAAYKIRDDLSAVPSSANQRIRVLRLLMSWAVKRDWIDKNPVLDIEPLKTGSGAKAWPDALLDRAGKELTGTLLTAFTLALYTGQRTADILTMRWGDIEGGLIRVKQSKGGAELMIPQHPKLSAHLKKAKKATKGLYMVARQDGKPLTPSGLKTLWHRQMRDMGVSGYAFHGLRKTASNKLAEAGCTPSQIAAITGHKTLAMVEHYTRQADQKRLATQAIDLWSGKRFTRNQDAKGNSR